MADLLRFDNVSLGYGKRSILHSLNFSLKPGDYMAIVGSNGSGKTTMLRGLLGLIRPRSGQVTKSPGLHYGYVPQLQTVDELFPLTIEDVVVMGRYGRIGALRPVTKNDRERARASLQEVGLGHMHMRLFRELSGGQKQRTCLLYTSPSPRDRTRSRMPSSA